MPSSIDPKNCHLVDQQQQHHRCCCLEHWQGLAWHPHGRTSLVAKDVPTQQLFDGTNGIHLALYPIQFILVGFRRADGARNDSPELGLEFCFAFVGEVPFGSFADRLDVFFRTTVKSLVEFTSQCESVVVLRFRIVWKGVFSTTKALSPSVCTPFSPYR